MPQIKGFELVGEFVGDDFGCGTECNDEDCILGLFAGFFEDLIAFFEGVLAGPMILLTLAASLRRSFPTPKRVSSPSITTTFLLAQSVRICLKT